MTSQTHKHTYESNMEGEVLDPIKKQDYHLMDAVMSFMELSNCYFVIVSSFHLLY